MNAYRFGDDTAAGDERMSEAEWRSLMAMEPWDDTDGTADEQLETAHREAIDDELARLAETAHMGPENRHMTFDLSDLDAHAELMGAFDWRRI